MIEHQYARGLDGNATLTAPGGSREQILQILALTFSSVSVLAAILTFYAFLAMRRSFRHEYVEN
jgi:hypothetical protein